MTESWLFCGSWESVKDSGIEVNPEGFLYDVAKLGIHHQTLWKINMEINFVHEILYSVIVHIFQRWFSAASLDLLKLTHKVWSVWL